MRSVSEWIGKSDDSAIPPRIRVRVFIRDDGRCQCGCRRKIIVGEKWETDHRIALINGGENREANLVTLLTEHHRTKTAADVAEKSKVARIRKKYLGIKSKGRPMPGSKASGWRKRMDGTVERR